MKKSQIYRVEKSELSVLRERLSAPERTWVAEIEGKSIKTYADYAEQISKCMKFPSPVEHSIDAYEDWIRGLQWLDSDGYLLVIHDFEEFMKEDSTRWKVVGSFLDTVLPWWDGEVDKYVTSSDENGMPINVSKAKPFNVILVD